MANTITIRVGARQTLEDLALQHYGTLEGVGLLLAHNRAQLTAGLTTPLTPGMELQVLRDGALNPDLVDQLKAQGVIPANGSYNETITGPDHNNDHSDDHG